MNLTLVPLDVTRQVRLHWPSVRKTLAGRRDRLARALRHVAREMASRSEGMVLHDPLAMALALEPGLVTTRALSVVVDSGHSHARGMSVADRRSTPRSTPGGPPVDVAMGIDADRALALITDRVLTRVGTVATRRLPTADVIVVGSANIDLTVAGVALPRPGETVTGGVQRTGFGGKGANQATEQLLGHPVSSTAAARRAAATLVSQGFGAALVTLGAHGVVWHDGGRGGHIPAKAVDVVDTTGAGDVFVGCLAAGLARGNGIEASIPRAVAAAARGVSRAGAR